VGGVIDPESEAHDLVMSGFGGMPGCHLSPGRGRRQRSPLAKV
jgi:hypothetical protein